MKQHAIIPIFVPHIGCSESCVFCDQNQITARSGAPTEEQVRNTIETWMSTLGAESGTSTEIEIAFYGGSFTAIPIHMQERYLKIAKEYIDSATDSRAAHISGNHISGIHISTRPDCITPEILNMLWAYGVRTIELGVQSFDDKVLELSKRGHDANAVYRACEMIRNFRAPDQDSKTDLVLSKNNNKANDEPNGFRLGIQLMIGLPGDSMGSCIYSAKETVKIAPELARLYPCVVLDDTELMDMYRSGAYTPLNRAEAIVRTKAMYEILDEAGIYIMRVGLKSTDIINSDNLGEINKGTYHPAFRQLVEGEIAKERIERLINKIESESESKSISRKESISNITVSCSPSWVSNAAGHNGANRKYFEEKYPNINIHFSSSDSLEPGEFAIKNKPLERTKL